MLSQVLEQLRASDDREITLGVDRENLAALIVICTVSLAATFAVTVWTVRLTSRLLERGKRR